MTKPEQCWDWETHTPKNFRRPRVGLVLSSGAAKGLAHIGVIQVFEETGIPVDAVAGASMGAYVGGLWAAGQSGVQLEELALSMKESRDRLELIDPVFPPRRGFIRGDKIANRLRATLGETNIENLPRDLSIIATELESFRRKVFREGDLVNAIRASIAIPGICVPYTLDGIDYVDGGIADPLPVQILREKVDLIIAVSVVPTADELEQGLPKEQVTEIPHSIWKSAGGWLQQHLNYFAKGNLLDILRKAAFASQIRLIERSAQTADFFIRASHGNAMWHDYHHAEEYIEYGRQAALQALPRLQQLLESYGSSQPPHPSYATHTASLQPDL